MIENYVITELKFRTQLIHLGLSEKSSVEQTLGRMRATKIQDLEQLRFEEWIRDQRGLEFTQVITVPYETPIVRIVMEDLCYKLAQYMDIVIGTLKQLMKHQKENLTNVPKTIREGIQAYFRQAKD